MRILINMLPEAGHINPTFPLASLLAGRGHEVIYTSFLDWETDIRRRGFGFVPVLCDHVPRGWLAQIEQAPTDLDRETAWGVIRDRVTEDYLDGRGVERTVRRIAPDIVLTDVVAISPMQFIAHRVGVPCLQISTSLAQRQDELPPLSSTLAPQAGEIELAAARWESTCISSFDPIPYTHIITNALDAHCVRFAYPRSEVSFRSMFWTALTAFPEALLCASAFDFPRSRSTAPTYLAVPVELDRRERISADLEAFAAGPQPLLYASLGSLPGRYPHAARFFRSIVEAMRLQPHLRAVIATGQRFSSHQIFASVPPNVMVVRTAPQLWLLRRAAIFITHGGLNSIREAIALQVPMIAVPQQHDQPGNAARIRHHQIGTHLTAPYISGEQMASAIERVLVDIGEHRERLAHMHRAILAEEAESRGPKIIEKLGAQRKRDRAPVALVAANTRVVPPACRGWLFAGSLAAVTMLRPGAQLRDGRVSEAVGVGTVGFTVYRDWGAALSRAAGPLLAHVEVSEDLMLDEVCTVGRSLRCLWSLDLSELLYDYAAWCALQALQSEQEREPETVAAFQALIHEFHRLRNSGASVLQLVSFSQGIFASAARLWSRGFGAAAAAVHTLPHIAAQLARLEATITLLRLEELKDPSDSAAGEACQQRIAAQLTAELDRRIAAQLCAAKLSVTRGDA